MTIGITGASGKFGRATVEALLNCGVEPGELVATSRDIAKLVDLKARGVVVRQADFSDPASLEGTFDGVDRVLVVSTNMPGNRVAEHRNAIDAAKAAGVGLIAYTSVLHASTALMHGVKEHLETENYLRASGIDYVILRNSWYFENYFVQLPSIRQSHIIYGSAGDGKVSGALRAEYAEAAAAVLATDNHEGAIYELGGDDAFTLSQLAEELTAKWDKQIIYKEVPVSELPDALAHTGLPRYIAAVSVDAHPGVARGELFTDSHDLGKLLGRPTTTLSEALSSVLD